MNTLRKMLAWQVVATHISVSPSNISNFRIKLWKVLLQKQTSTVSLGFTSIPPTAWCVQRIMAVDLLEVKWNSSPSLVWLCWFWWASWVMPCTACCGNGPACAPGERGGGNGVLMSWFQWVKFSFDRNIYIPLVSSGPVASKQNLDVFPNRTCSDFRMPPYVITVVITVVLPMLSASPTGACVFWAWAVCQWSSDRRLVEAEHGWKGMEWTQHLTK